MPGMEAVGILIRLERLRREWSQEGLCKGICAVSYLSKIEQGKVQPDSELISVLFERLGKTWHDDEQTCQQGKNLCEALYEAFLTGDTNGGISLLPKLEENWEILSCSPFLADILALKAHWTNDPSVVPSELVALMNSRQRCLCALAENDYRKAWNIYPCAMTTYIIGTQEYADGHYTQALEHSQLAYDLASREGSVLLMMNCQLNMANCYSNLGNAELMTEHHRIAERIARAVGDTEKLRIIRYNTMSTEMELGHYEESYAYFSSLQNPEALDLHKLAICCEKLGKSEEALSVLQRAEKMEVGSELIRHMCQLVRYRLEHPAYLRDATYGRLLLDTFHTLRRHMPKGYAVFHLPWVQEWLTANRQYRQAYELMLDFTK